MAEAETTIRVETSRDAGPAPEAIHAEAAARATDVALRAQTSATTTVSDTLKDIDGNFSSKRIAAFLALAVFLLMAAADTVARRGQASEFVMTDLVYIVIAGLSLGAVERFGGAKPKGS